jgi:hypothetical protein
VYITDYIAMLVREKRSSLFVGIAENKKLSIAKIPEWRG